MRNYFFIGLILSGGYQPILNAESMVYKCTASNGAVTFNDSGCPSDSLTANYSLSASMTIPAQLKKPNKQSASKQRTKQTRVTVITEREQPCGAFDPSARRTHLVRQQITSGMSQADVESMFGKPLTQRNHNSSVSATYRGTKGQQHKVRYDKNGCVP